MNQIFSFVIVLLLALISGCSIFENKDSSENLNIVRIFPEKPLENQIFDARILVSPLLDFSQRKARIIVPVENGIVAMHDAETGLISDKIFLPVPEGKRIQISATPVIHGANLIVVYQTIEKGRRVSYHVVVVDLENNKINDAYPAVELRAEKPTADKFATVKFNPVNAYPHSALKFVPRKNSRGGLVYVSFGNAADMQPYHGWVFEIDLHEWRQQGSSKAISNVLVITPESDCPVAYKSGNKEMICGGGVWSPAGPQVDFVDDSFELLIPTGNGQIDLLRKDYANTLMRVKQGLQFDPECDTQLCADFDPVNPALTCIESCKNLFIPRLDPKNSPLKPVSGDCDDKSFWQCLAWMDYDLGANSPVKVALKNGHKVWVQAGKEGGVYLIDADHLGTQYDRMQIIDICGTKADPCKLSWRGMIVTHPVVSYIDEDPIVIIPTFISDSTHEAGLIALKIVMENDKPKFKKLWQFSGSPNKPKTESFRSHPTLPVIAKMNSNGQSYVWVVDIGKPGILYGVRVKDGTLAAEISLIGTGYPLSKPVIYNNKIYVVSNKAGVKKAWLEGYRVEVQKQ